MLSAASARTSTRSRERGLSIVELLVGVAVGLFLVAGAVTLFVSNLGNSRQMLLEARVNQDLRAAADLIARDLRRAAYWGNSLAGTVASGSGSTTTPNPYRAITTTGSSVEYNLSRDAAGADNNTLDNNEQFGFQRAVQSGMGVVQMKLGADNWQTVTDPQTIDVTALAVTPTVTAVDIRDSCSRTCCTAADVAAGTAGCAAVTLSSGTCPVITVRQYLLVVTANATGIPQVSRTLRTRVRARNDEYAGVCPS